MKSTLIVVILSKKPQKVNPTSIQPLSPNGIGLTFNNHKQILHEFDKSDTIQSVMQYFLSVRLAHEATAEEMKEYCLVDFNSPRAPLPLKSTISKCGLTNGTRMESEASSEN